MSDLLSRLATECGLIGALEAGVIVALWLAWAKERRGRVADLREIARLAALDDE